MLLIYVDDRTSGHQWGAQRAQALSASKESHTSGSKEPTLTTSKELHLSPSMEKSVQEMNLNSPSSPSPVDEKLRVLKQWGLNTIQSELRFSSSKFL